MDDRYRTAQRDYREKPLRENRDRLLREALRAGLIAEQPRELIRNLLFESKAHLIFGNHRDTVRYSALTGLPEEHKKIFFKHPSVEIYVRELDELTAEDRAEVKRLSAPPAPKDLEHFASINILALDLDEKRLLLGKDRGEPLTLEMISSLKLPETLTELSIHRNDVIGDPDALQAILPNIKLPTSLKKIYLGEGVTSTWKGYLGLDRHDIHFITGNPSDW